MAVVDAALGGCDRVIATIFVNPIQFGPSEDFRVYPRDEAGDARKLEERGCHALFAPSVEEMFPGGPENFRTVVQVRGITDGLCGAFRPGHFEGVATIVAKLFGAIQPDAAYFGEKDFQQLQVIRQMCRDLDMSVTIAAVPTVRESDGLALSSRNRYLSAAERAVAPQLYLTLRRLAEQLAVTGADADMLEEQARRHLLSAGFTKVDYITAADVESLQPPRHARANARVFGAAWLGRTRLIDNVPLKK
jgi:pantoate--beta-alanine ligase